FRDEKRGKNPCKSLRSLTDEHFARIIAKHLKIRFVSLNTKEQYRKEVIEPMIKDYQKGLTPNPDVSCNTLIKFPILLEQAKKLKADYIATGHYARINKTKSGFKLLQAKDPGKDQSYFLYQLNQKILSKLIFPIGNLTKKEVRKIAKQHKFLNWNKPGTTGVCYLGKTPNIKSFLEKKIKQKKGRIISPEGEVLGTHPGISYFTIGQKILEHLGMHINKPKEHAQERYYVADKRKSNILIAAPENHPFLLKKKVFIRNFHLINPNQSFSYPGLTARIRHLGELHKGELSNNRIFTFQKPVKGIAEGQAIVLYHKNRVIGGGEIRLK
ncbi:MAG: tRNA 2-thiouridine(34) synthase MnmA, partial [archaeon]|nr:tRNA 2-thiouridine(34) synthase MnmA [archaeon]